MKRGGGDHQNSPAHPLERLIFFSDAVFAIAITLLIIEVRPPQLTRHATDRDHLIALINLTPSFFAFFVSFFVIGAFWAGHHRAFSLARHWSPSLVRPNIMMLASVVFMPFATAYMGLNMGQRVPTVLYDLVLLVTGLLNIWLVRRATSPPVVDEEADPLTIARTRGRGWGVTAGAALAAVLAFFTPNFAQFALLTIPLCSGFRLSRPSSRSSRHRLSSRRYPPDFPAQLPHLNSPGAAAGLGDRPCSFKREAVIERVEPFKAADPTHPVEPINAIRSHHCHPL